jgi:hypothetical protein
LLLVFLMLPSTALASGDANEAFCPNETSPGFRSYLPECRAYEQVTPVFKDGTRLGPRDVSEDGSRLLAESLGSFAGSESDTESHGSVYELSRSSSGWNVSAISPPASELPAQRLLAASPELGETLWLARAPSESLAAANFYVRESDGAIAELGPLLPPSDTSGPPAGESQGFLYGFNLLFEEASEDFSGVLFDLFGLRAKGLPLWPGDTTTGQRSLYEYSARESSHAELVGVNSEGRLISSCETFLGSAYEHELYNAVSADGGTVFYTAASCTNQPGEPHVNELYARLGTFPIDSVAISEPPFNACEECQTGIGTFRHPAVSEQPAEFAGASRDGSLAFFTTRQELLSGAMGENLYEYDFDNPEGHKVVRVSTGSEDPEVQGVARVSENGTHAYFVAHGVLTREARESEGGRCLAELGAPEKVEEEEKAHSSETKEEEEQNNGEEPKGSRCRPRLGGDNLYMFERDAADPAGRLAFVATLSSSDGGPYGDWSGEDHRPVQATPDGQFLVFRSVADLTAGDTSAVPEIFEYDAMSEALVRVSRGASDYEPQGTDSADEHAATIPSQGYASEDVPPGAAANDLAVSDDGSTVVFEDSGALTAEALPALGIGNVYEYYNTVGSGGPISEGDVYLISDGTNRLAVGLFGLDGSGDDVFFKTADQLVPQDTDTQYDIYDARVDGGFPGPDPPTVCEGCEEPPLVQPLASAPAVAANATGAVPSASTPVVSGAAEVRKGALTPAEERTHELVRAVKACRAKRKTEREECDALARKRYGARRTMRRARVGKS